jgi:Helix-hairpin-helix motif
VAKLRVVLVGGSFIAAMTLGLLCAAPTDVVAQTAKGAALAEKVDLNSASEAELDKLPGVGKATAKKIIAGRPYQSVGDLSKAGVSKSTIEKITPLVTVGPTSPSAAAAPPAAPAPTQRPKAGTPETTKPSQVEAKTPPVAGMVWVNTKTKIFHREGDRWYGKTKEGKFMTEAEALKEGYRPSKEGAAKKSAKE